jgi:hypothetical protein
MKLLSGFRGRRKAHEAPVVLVKVMRSYDNLRTDPRYLEFLRDLQFPD